MPDRCDAPKTVICNNVVVAVVVAVDDAHARADLRTEFALPA